jgi:hypothetical protein
MEATGFIDGPSGQVRAMLIYAADREKDVDLYLIIVVGTIRRSF